MHDIGRPQSVITVQAAGGFKCAEELTDFILRLAGGSGFTGPADELNRATGKTNRPSKIPDWAVIADSPIPTGHEIAEPPR